MSQTQRIQLAHLPTPIQDLPRLTAALGGPMLLLKRDDQTGLAFGGNKTRKLEYILADVQNCGARTLITGGAVQSNHCRQTAAAAAQLGLDCMLVLSGEPNKHPTGNHFLDQLFGAEIIYTTREERDSTMQLAFDQAHAQNRKPYLIPYGGSNATGASAYAFAIQEMLSQRVEPDWIVHATSSGGTQAGLVAGAKMYGFHGKVLGISIDETRDSLTPRVTTLATEVTEKLGAKKEIDPDHVIVNDDYLGEGYGIMGDIEKEAIRLFAQQEGILLDPVYTGRAAAGLIHLIRSGFFSPIETVMFWHTGGTPALLAERYHDVLE